MSCAYEKKVYKVRYFPCSTRVRGDIVSVCEICGLEATKIFICTKCGAKFCEECGDLKKKLCYDCTSWDEEEELEDNEEEEKDEDWDEWSPP